MLVMKFLISSTRYFEEFEATKFMLIGEKYTGSSVQVGVKSDLCVHSWCRGVHWDPKAYVFVRLLRKSKVGETLI